MTHLLKICLILLVIRESKSTCKPIWVRSNWNRYRNKKDISGISCSNLESIQKELNQLDSNINMYYYKIHSLTIRDSNISTIIPSELSKFSKLQKLDISGQHVQKIFPEAFAGLNSLKELYLNDNSLTEITYGVFNSLQQLEILNLTNNKIYSIKNFAFMGMSNLKHFYLNKNNILVLKSGTFDKLYNLTTLDISENPIRAFLFLDLSKSKKYLANLTMSYVDLSYCQFAEFNFSIFFSVTHFNLSNSKIKTVRSTINSVELNLSHNELEILEDSTLDHTNPKFESLDFSYNKISKIENCVFCNLTDLRHLNLKFNNISQIYPKLFNDLQNLTTLDLSENQIEEFSLEIFYNFSENFSGLQFLKMLNLTYNKIDRIENFTFITMSNLKQLYLNKNQISVLGSRIFENLYNLETLDVSENQIKTINTKLNSVKFNLSHNELEILEDFLLNHTKPRFEILDFSYNKISKIENNVFCNLTRLINLNLKHNQITKISSKLFIDLKNVMTLDLSENQIEEISYGAFDNLIFLQFLNISNNKITNLNYLHSLSNLEFLYFDNNLITSFDTNSLQVHLPKLNEISLNHNYLNCDQLIEIKRFFRDRLLEGDSFDDENVYGISCVNQNFKNLENSLKTAENFSQNQFSQFLINYKNAVEISLNRSKTDFSQLIQVQDIYSYKILVFGVIILIIILFVLIFNMYFMYNFSKKISVYNQRTSQLELC